MTLTRASIESRVLTGATNPSGSHSSSATRTATGGRYQQLVTTSWSDTTIPAPHVATNSFGFLWEELVTLAFINFQSILGYNRYVRVTVWRGFMDVTTTGVNTVDFGTLAQTHGTTSRFGGWTHTQFQGFTAPSADNGADYIVQSVADSGTAPNTTFGGQNAEVLVLPDALADAESLHLGFCGFEHGTGTADYTTDGTKTVLLNAVSSPGAGEVILRNSQDIYFGVSVDAGDQTDWTAWSYELGETPIVVEPPDPEGGNQGFDEYWDVLFGTASDASDPAVTLPRAFPDLSDADPSSASAGTGTVLGRTGSEWGPLSTLDGGAP